MESKTIVHPIEPVYDAESKILILGSFPSVKSREQMFFYGHPQNRFWRLLENFYGVELKSIEAKKSFLFSHHIALWDSIGQCEITGSSDASIKNVVPNDLSRILETAEIKKVFCNGKKSFELYQKYLYSKTGMGAVCLPSTSPANASCSFEKLLEEWKVIKEDL